MADPNPSSRSSVGLVLRATRDRSASVGSATNAPDVSVVQGWQAIKQIVDEAATLTNPPDASPTELVEVEKARTLVAGIAAKNPLSDDDIKAAKAGVAGLKQAIDTSSKAVQTRLKQEVGAIVAELAKLKNPANATPEELVAVTHARDVVTAIAAKSSLTAKDVQAAKDGVKAVQKAIAEARSAVQARIKKEFTQAFLALGSRAKEAKKADAGLFGIAVPLQEMNAALNTVVEKQTAKDFSGALALLNDLDSKIKAVEDLVSAAQKAKKKIDDEWAKLDADMNKAKELLTPTSALAAAEKTYLDARKRVQDEYDTAKNYPAGALLLAPLKTALKDFLKAAAENDKTAGKKAADAKKSVDDLIKSKKLAGKTNADKIQLLKDLRGLTTKMTPEFRAAQCEIYKAIKLDADFVKEDKKQRKEIIKALVPDKAAKTEFKDKRKNWSKQSDAEKIGMIKKAVDAQSAVLGIPSPEIVAVNKPPEDGLITNGYFSRADGKIYINLHPESSVNDFEKAIDLAFHENSHNHQNELVKKLKKGDMDKNSPLYEQALLFEVNFENQGYVRGREDFSVYKKQPVEEHAHQNGPKTAKAFMKAIR